MSVSRLLCFTDVKGSSFQMVTSSIYASKIFIAMYDDFAAVRFLKWWGLEN